MCVYSMIIDHYSDKWATGPGAIVAIPPQSSPFISSVRSISDEEIQEFRLLLEKAREYDLKNNQPDCELEEKKVKIRKLADELGINIDFI